jgi:hypothetical protein
LNYHVKIVVVARVNDRARHGNHSSEEEDTAAKKKQDDLFLVENGAAQMGMTEGREIV